MGDRPPVCFAESAPVRCHAAIGDRNRKTQQYRSNYTPEEGEIQRRECSLRRLQDLGFRAKGTRIESEGFGIPPLQIGIFGAVRVEQDVKFGRNDYGWNLSRERWGRRWIVGGCHAVSLLGKPEPVKKFLQGFSRLPKRQRNPTIIVYPFRGIK